MADDRDSSDLEIADVENYRSDKLQLFNHQALIMECMRKCNEAGSHEMRSGWIDEKVDSGGNVTRKYFEDSRKKFIENVKTLTMNIICDLDEDATENIEQYEDDLKDTKKKLLGEQWKWWLTQTPKLQAMWASNSEDVKIYNRFNARLPWWQDWVDAEIDCYRRIFAEIVLLTKRLDFYRAEDFEA